VRPTRYPLGFLTLHTVAALGGTDITALDAGGTAATPVKDLEWSNDGCLIRTRVQPYLPNDHGGEYICLE
jgi:hypothetical protein